MSNDQQKIIAREEQRLESLAADIAKSPRPELLAKTNSLRALWQRCKEAAKQKQADLKILVEKYAGDFLSLKWEADKARIAPPPARALSPAEKIIFSLLKREWLPFKSLLCEGKQEAAKKWIVSVINFCLKETNQEAGKWSKEAEAIAQKACDTVLALANEQKHRIKDGFLKKIFGGRSDAEKIAELIRRDFITPGQLAELVAGEVKAILSQPLPAALADAKPVILAPEPESIAGIQSALETKEIISEEAASADDWGEDEDDKEPWEQGKEGIAG
ncbi:hypothetical protein EPN28_01230 [Patescibacteria group bacterium]|nr:MAG: hypothetical protein EPN28_01230 [Patescibacteria group bacterium]